MQEKMLYLATDRKIGSTYNKKKKEILGYAFYNRCKRIKRTYPLLQTVEYTGRLFASIPE